MDIYNTLGMHNSSFFMSSILVPSASVMRILTGGILLVMVVHTMLSCFGRMAYGDFSTM